MTLNLLIAITVAVIGGLIFKKIRFPGGIISNYKAHKCYCILPGNNKNYN